MSFQGIFSYAPEPHIAFCPILVHPIFPVFEPQIHKWVIFVPRRPCVCDTLRFESLFRQKRSILAPTPSSTPADCDNWPSRKSKRRLHKEHGLRPPVGFQPPFLLNIAGQLKVQRWVFRCLRVFRVLGVFGVFTWGLVVGFNFGFGRTKTTRNVTWGSVLTPCEKIEVGQK